ESGQPYIKIISGYFRTTGRHGFTSQVIAVNDWRLEKDVRIKTIYRIPYPSNSSRHRVGSVRTSSNASTS
ncbi:MAG: hypothetical protein JW860_03955, partial [Sedimentisphaerales bacterium]|nr:hypothetical protein [Sedimentisphaerales bacterium]